MNYLVFFYEEGNLKPQSRFWVTALYKVFKRWKHWWSEAYRDHIWAASWQNQQNGYALSKDSDQPGHPPSLIRVFAVRMKTAWVFTHPLSGQQRLWSDWADAQADLSLRWAHTHFVGFVMSWLICKYTNAYLHVQQMHSLLKSHYYP